MVTLTTGLLLTLLLPGQSADESPVEQGRNAFRNAGSIPWYDASTDDWKSVVPPEPVPPPNLPQISFGFPATFAQALALLGSALIWTLLAVVLGLLVYVLFRYLDRRDPVVQEARIDTSITIDRIEALPTPMRRDVDFLTEAERLAAAGKLGEAIVYLYGHVLLLLDHAGRLRLAKGKTNRRYVWEVAKASSSLRQGERLRSTFEQLVRTFEDAFFGHRPPTGEEFAALWDKRDDFSRWAEAAR